MLATENIEFQNFPHPEARDNVAILALLLPKGDAARKGPICVANTHILYNWKRGDMKLGQVQYLMNRIPYFIQSHSSLCAKLSSSDQTPEIVKCNDRLIICGDFNSAPNSKILKFVLEGILECKNLNRKMMDGLQNPAHSGRGSQSSTYFSKKRASKSNEYDQKIGMTYSRNPSKNLVKFDQKRIVSKKKSDKEDFFVPLHFHPCDQDSLIHHPFELSSVYSSGISQKHSTHQIMVDYIFHSNLQCLSYFTLPEKHHFPEKLPNQFAPSDHMFLLAKFSI